MLWHSLSLVLGIAVTAANEARCLQTADTTADSSGVHSALRQTTDERASHVRATTAYAPRPQEDGRGDQAESSNSEEELTRDHDARRWRRNGAAYAADAWPSHVNGSQVDATRPPEALQQRRLRWGAGLRAQTTYSEGTWLQLGVDAVVYPHRALGVGLTALQGASLRASDCESSSADPCGPHWRSLLPFAEMRLRPLSWISPYLRGAVGTAWGRFDDSAKRGNNSILAARSELGVDFHRNVSFRFYVAYERFEGSGVRLGGLGGGMQLGLTL